MDGSNCLIKTEGDYIIKRNVNGSRSEIAGDEKGKCRPVFRSVQQLKSGLGDLRAHTYVMPTHPLLYTIQAPGTCRDEPHLSSSRFTATVRAEKCPVRVGRLVSIRFAPQGESMGNLYCPWSL